MTQTEDPFMRLSKAPPEPPPGLLDGAECFAPNNLGDEGQLALIAHADGDLRPAIPLDWIAPSAINPRTVFEESALEELAQNIRIVGVLQPILVRPISTPPPHAPLAQFSIVAGERRWRASRLAGCPTIPCLVRTEMDDKTARLLAFTENWQRADLNPMEKARSLSALIGEGYTQEELAAKLSMSRSTLANTVRLLKLPPEVQMLLAEGRLSMSHALPLLRYADDPEAVSQIAQAVVDDSLPSRLLEAREWTGRLADILTAHGLPNGKPEAPAVPALDLEEPVPADKLAASFAADEPPMGFVAASELTEMEEDVNDVETEQAELRPAATGEPRAGDFGGAASAQYQQPAAENVGADRRSAESAARVDDNAPGVPTAAVRPADPAPDRAAETAREAITPASVEAQAAALSITSTLEAAIAGDEDEQPASAVHGQSTEDAETTDNHAPPARLDSAESVLPVARPQTAAGIVPRDGTPAPAPASVGSAPAAKPPMISCMLPENEYDWMLDHDFTPATVIARLRELEEAQEPAGNVLRLDDRYWKRLNRMAEQNELAPRDILQNLIDNAYADLP